MQLAPNSIQVDTLIDENDGDLSTGDVSLREALATVDTGGKIIFSDQLANADEGFGEGVIGLSLGELTIDKSISLEGLGAEKLTVSGNNESRVFRVLANDVVLDGLTITEGASEEGGGILASGNLIVTNSNITGNSEGITKSGYADLTVSNSIVSGNTGNGINWNDSGGNIAVSNSEISNNGEQGISAYSSNYYRQLTLTNSQVNGNGNSGIEVSGSISIDKSSVSNNNGSAAESIYFGGAQVSVVESVISGNSGTAVVASGKYSADVSFVDSSINNNGGVTSTGAQYNVDSVSVTGSTLSGNRGSLSSSSIFFQDSVATGNTSYSVLSGYSVSVQNSKILSNSGLAINATQSISLKESTIDRNAEGGVQLRASYGSYGYSELSIVAENSTISGNGSQSSNVGGISVSASNSYYEVSARFQNTTISGNTSARVGGVLLVETSASYAAPFVSAFENVTISNNKGGLVGGVSLSKSNIPYITVQNTLQNTIIAGNTGPVADLEGELDSLGFNLIGDGSDTTGFEDTDIVGSERNPLDPLLSALQDNGGFTLTQAPRPDSLAIDGGDPNTQPSGFDQRGADFVRLVDGDGDGTARIDIGAVEVQPTDTPIFHVINGDRRRNRLFGAGGRDLISGFNGPDTLKGRGDDDILLGGAGKDRLFGDGGDDILTGGLGQDKLKGGGGNDTFVYERLNEGKDIILDFKIGQDLIDLSAILDGARYDSDTPFEDYIRLGKVGPNTRLEVLNANASRGGREVFKEIAIIRNTSPGSLDESSFVL